MKQLVFDITEVQQGNSNFHCTIKLKAKIKKTQTLMILLLSSLPLTVADVPPLPSVRRFHAHLQQIALNPSAHMQFQLIKNKKKSYKRILIRSFKCTTFEMLYGSFVLSNAVLELSTGFL